MRRGLGDALMSVGALAILGITLVSVDARVREYVVRMSDSASIRNTSATLADVGSAVLLAARDQTLAHAPLTIFVVAAAVLVVCMLRT